MLMAIPGISRSTNDHAGMTLMPVVLMFVIAGALIGAGITLVGPVTRRIQTNTTNNLIDRASRSVIAWSMVNNRLPTASEFVVAAGVRDDGWHHRLVYVFDGSLTATASGGLCGRESTGIVANGEIDVAFFILSGSEDFTVDTTPAISGAYTGNATISGLDLAEVVSLADLHNRAGCFDRTTGRLTILNNELPEGCSNESYRGDLFAQGGVPPYTWTATTLPTWMTLTQIGTAFHCSGAPPDPGVSTLVTTVTDSTGTTVQRRFDLTVASCTTGPAPVPKWNFNEGAGPTVGDSIGPGMSTAKKNDGKINKNRQEQRGKNDGKINKNGQEQRGKNDGAPSRSLTR